MCVLDVQGGSRCYVGGRVDTSGHFFIFSNLKVSYDVAFRSSLGRFFSMSKRFVL